MKIVSLVSREWSYEITEQLFNEVGSRVDFTLIATKNIKIKKKNFNLLKIKKSLSPKHIRMIRSLSPDLILTYGWSDYLSKELRKIAPCLILHPSKLPKYRGGSPIQNQIINGVNRSAVTILYAGDKIDSGEILFQEEISFKGYLNEILYRMIKKGIKGTKKILKLYKSKKLKSLPQNHKNATYFKRRKPDQSKIDLNDFKKYEAKYFYNLVRGLQEPYPLSYIECKNKTKLYIKKVHIGKK